MLSTISEAKHITRDASRECSPLTYVMNSISRILFLFLLTLTFISCNRYKEVYFIGETQGTYYALTYFDKDGRYFQTKIDSILYNFDQSASLWVPSSLISRINESDTSVIADEVIQTLFAMSMKVSEKSDGHFDFTIGPLVNAWGFGFKNGVHPDSLMVDSLKKLVDYTKVMLQDGRIIKSDPRIKFDFNAIAQGYAVDIVGDFLESKGIENYIIDIGGEVLAKGKKPGNKSWIVGIEKPSEDIMEGRQTQIKIQLNNKAVATSGSYRKFYIKDGIKYSHTINPKTGYPVSHSLLSCTVVADDAATADAYATALMVMGLPEAFDFAKSLTGIEALFISDAGDGKYSVKFTEGFEGIIRE